MITQVINAVIALISGKLIAAYVAPNDFGEYSLQWAIVIFFTSILIAPFMQYVKSTEITNMRVIGSKIYLFSALILIVISVASVSLFFNFYNGNLNLTLFIILLLFLPLYTFNGILTNHLNITGQIKLFCSASILKGLAGLVFLVIYISIDVFWFSDSQMLWLMQVVSILLGSIFFVHKYSFLKAKRKIAFKTFVKKYLKFALPLMMMAFWAWINNYFDRYAIEYYMTIKDVGIYNASYSLGSKFFLMLSPVFVILLNPLLFGKNNIANKKRDTSKFAFYYVIIALPILAFIFFFYNIIGEILLSEQYKEGFVVIFWTALAFFLFTLTQLIELYFYSEKKTVVILKGNFIGAVINIFLNILLIPDFGLIGASMASVLGFFAYFGFIVYCFINLNGKI